MTREEVIPTFDELMALARPVAESVDPRIPVGAGLNTFVSIAQSGGKLEAISTELTGPVEWMYDRVRRNIIPEPTDEELAEYAEQAAQIKTMIEDGS